MSRDLWFLDRVPRSHMKIIISFLLFLACGTGYAMQDADRNALPLRAWFWYLPETLDPYMAEQFSLLPLAKNIYAPLVSTYMEGTAQGMIAESWTVSRDGLTWRFKPRKGLSFQGGGPINAQAIIANFRRMLWHTRGEKLALNALLPELKTWKSYDAPFKSLVEENGEVVFRFAKRPKNLFEAVSQPIYNIADPKCFDKKGDWLSPFCAGGSGEYVITGRYPGRLTLSARHVYKRVPHAPELVEVIVPAPGNMSSLKFMLEQNGHLAIKTSLEVDSEFMEMVRPTGIQRRSLPAFQMNFAVLNPFRPPFNDPELRRSFRDVFLARLQADPFFSPDTKVDPSFTPEGVIGYVRQPVPKGKKALLSHAGEKVTVFMNAKSANAMKKKRVFGDIVRQAVLDSLERHGLRPELIDPSAEEYWERMKKGDYDLLLQGSAMAVENPFDTLRTLFMRGKWDGLPNTSTKIGRWVEAAEAGSDPAERRRLAENINREIMNDAAVVPYAHSGLVYLFKPGVDLSKCSMFLSPMEFRAVGWEPEK